jgi:hypothetical protein
VASEDDLVEIIAGYERLAAWVAAGQLAAIAEFARRPVVFGSARDEGLVRRGPVGVISRQSVGTELGARLTV